MFAAVERSPDVRLKYTTYRVNADRLLLEIGIFDREHTEALRCRWYYGSAQAYSQQLARRRTGMSEVLDKAFRTTGRYTTLTVVRREYFNLVETLSAREWAELQRDVSHQHPTALIDQLLDVYSAMAEARGPSISRRWRGCSRRSARSGPISRSTCRTAARREFALGCAATTGRRPRCTRSHAIAETRPRSGGLARRVSSTRDIERHTRSLPERRPDAPAGSACDAAIPDQGAGATEDTDMTDIAMKGAAIGFAVAAPVGPIGLLVMRRAAAHGWAAGFVVGAGAATADALYGVLAGCGVHGVSVWLATYGTWIRLGGGALLLALAIHTIRARPATHEAALDSRGLLRGWLGACALTLANPATILSFAAVFTGAGIVLGSGASVAWLVGGVLCGSLAWWATLASGVSVVRSRLTPAVMRGVNVVAGSVLAVWAVRTMAVALAR